MLLWRGKELLVTEVLGGHDTGIFVRVACARMLVVTITVVK